jgi:hypothetical protein
MTESLDDLIKACIEAVPGPEDWQVVASYHGKWWKEFALCRYANGNWLAEISNSSPDVTIGEAGGDFWGEGETALEAVSKLLGKLKRNPKRCNPNKDYWERIVERNERLIPDPEGEKDAVDRD